MRKKTKGFTLIELIIVVAIIGVLAAIAMANYTDYITRGRRTDATVALMEMANLQTRFFSNNLTYTTSVAALPYTATSMDGHYNLSVAAITASSFTLQAAATGTQATNDPDCATFTLTALGAKTSSPDSDCW